MLLDFEHVFFMMTELASLTLDYSHSSFVSWCLSYRLAKNLERYVALLTGYQLKACPWSRGEGWILPNPEFHEK